MSVENNKYLTFMLSDESYGMPIIKVKEIIGMMVITNVPGMPEFMRGVINLRGKIIPVIDLRLKFGFGEREYDDRTCIIVVEMSSKKGEKLSGFVVDTVSEVLDIDEESIEAPPSYGDNSVDQAFLKGMGKVADKVIMLLEAERIFSENEIPAISESS